MGKAILNNKKLWNELISWVKQAYSKGSRANTYKTSVRLKDKKIVESVIYKQLIKVKTQKPIIDKQKIKENPSITLRKVINHKQREQDKKNREEIQKQPENN